MRLKFLVLVLPALILVALVASGCGGGGSSSTTTAKKPKVEEKPQLSKAQFITQAKAVCLTLVWSGVGSFLLFSIVKMVVGLRPGTDQEREGLDLVDHGERAYNY